MDMICIVLVIQIIHKFHFVFQNKKLGLKISFFLKITQLQ